VPAIADLTLGEGGARREPPRRSGKAFDALLATRMWASSRLRSFPFITRPGLALTWGRVPAQNLKDEASWQQRVQTLQRRRQPGNGVGGWVQRNGCKVLGFEC
jgi:hypothetical protein